MNHLSSLLIWFGSLKCRKTGDCRQLWRLQNSHKQVIFPTCSAFPKLFLLIVLRSNQWWVTADCFTGSQREPVTGAEVSFWLGLFISMQNRMDWIHKAIDLVIFNCYSLNGWLDLSYISHVLSAVFMAKQWKKVRQHHHLGAGSEWLAGISLCTISDAFLFASIPFKIYHPAQSLHLNVKPWASPEDI